MIEIKEVCKQDYKKAQKFAIQGMHLDWYMDSKVILDLYAKYFWYMELNRATKVMVLMQMIFLWVFYLQK